VGRHAIGPLHPFVNPSPFDDGLSLGSPNSLEVHQLRLVVCVMDNHRASANNVVDSVTDGPIHKDVPHYERILQLTDDVCDLKKRSRRVTSNNGPQRLQLDGAINQVSSKIPVRLPDGPPEPERVWLLLLYGRVAGFDQNSCAPLTGTVTVPASVCSHKYTVWMVV
jgi:hypothetical protein